MVHKKPPKLANLLASLQAKACKLAFSRLGKRRLWGVILRFRQLNSPAMRAGQPAPVGAFSCGYSHTRIEKAGVNQEVMVWPKLLRKLNQ